MKHPGRIPLLLVASGAMVIGSTGCAKKDEPGPAAASSTTARPAGTTPASGGTGTTAAANGSVGTTEAAAAALKELSNSDIRRELSTSKPELWALVNFDYLSWTSFTGYNVMLKVGADTSKAVEICEALSALVYDSTTYKPTPKTSIVVAKPADANDVQGTPLAKRGGKTDTCKKA